jgi:sarcosine oxidase subunit beta
VPVALGFATDGQSVLVIESLTSPGQGQDRKAIGGIRAKHSEKGKIKIRQRSIEIFAREEVYISENIKGDELWLSSK